MARRRKYAPIERLRRVLLVGLVALLTAFVAIYVRQRADRPEDERPRRSLFDDERRQEVVLAGEGFEFEQRDGDRRVFRLEADRILSNREGRIELERVRLEVTREADEPYYALSDRGVYQVESSTARLEGSVRVRSGEAMELRTEGLELVRKGAALASTGPVSFELGQEFAGRADRLVYHLQKNRLRLAGGVLIRATGPEGGQLRCDELVIEREERLVRAEGNVLLERGASRLEAKRLSLLFAPDEKTLEFVRASWEVAGSLRPATGADMGSTTAFRGNQLSIAFDAGEPTKAELEEAPGARVTLESVDDGGLSRRMQAPYLMADLAGGKIAIVRAYDGAEIDERLAVGQGFPLRQVCAQWLLAAFDAEGELEEMVLQNEVDYREPGLQATGDRVRSTAAGELTMSGSLVTLRSDRGRVEAPRVSYSASAGRMQALEGVQVEFPEGGSFALIGEDPGVPIRLSSREAEWVEAPAEFTFRGEVRAWQGDNYLLADRLVGDRSGERLRALGRVKTVMRRQAEEVPESAESSPTGNGGENDEDGEAREAQSGPIEVTASELVYERPQKLLTYSGAVQAHDAGRTMRCLKLDALMDERDEIDVLTCDGSLVIENPKMGHTVRGDKAIYEPKRGRMEISGTPVVMSDRKGSALRGPIVIYDLETGAAQVRGLPPPPRDPAGDPPT